jgi:hypothetical protein
LFSDSYSSIAQYNPGPDFTGSLDNSHVLTVTPHDDVYLGRTQVGRPD